MGNRQGLDRTLPYIRSNNEYWAACNDNVDMNYPWVDLPD